MASATALSDADALLEESLEEEEEEDEDEPDEPELNVEADDDAVEDDASPELSVVVCEAVSQAATKKATATRSAIRRCNMVMLPGLFRFNVLPGYRIMVPARPVSDLFTTHSGLGTCPPLFENQKTGSRLRHMTTQVP